MLSNLMNNLEQLIIMSPGLFACAIIGAVVLALLGIVLVLSIGAVLLSIALDFSGFILDGMSRLKGN